MFDFIHISTAFARCGHLASRAPAQPTSFHPLLQRGKAGYAEAALLDACITRLVDQAAGAAPQALANVVYSAALLQEHGYNINKQQALQLVAALVQKQQDATPQALANTLWAAATLGLQLPKEHAQQLVAALVQKRQDATPQNLANTLWAAATLGLQLPKEHAQQLVAALVQKRQVADPQHLANTLWAAATMGLQLPEDYALQLVEALMQKRQDATPQALANTLWAAATMGLQLRKQHTQQLVAALVQQREQASPQALANTALALAKPLNGMLGLHDAQLFAALTVAAKPKMQQFTSQAISNLCWAVAVADQQQLFEVAMVRQVAGASMWSSTAAEHLMQLYQVHLWLLDVQKASSGLAGALSPAQLQRCREAWEELLQQRAQQGRSRFEREVYQCCAEQLHSLLTDCSQEACTEDGAFSIDVVATHTASGKRLAIEADGPTHFLRPGRHVNGETVSRNRALAARGYVVVSVPYWEWDELKKSDQAAYLARKVEGVVLKQKRGSGSGGGRVEARGRSNAASAPLCLSCVQYV